jgi:hypothetical protein
MQGWKWRYMRVDAVYPVPEFTFNAWFPLSKAVAFNDTRRNESSATKGRKEMHYVCDNTFDNRHLLGKQT